MDELLKQQADNAAFEILEGPLPNMLFDRAEKMPERIFLEEVDGASIGYGAFVDHVGRYITALKTLGVAKGSRVAVYMPQSIEAHAVWNAIAWMTGWEIPINNEFHGQMLAYVLNDSQATIIVATSQYLPLITVIASQLDHLKTILVAGDIGDIEVEGLDFVAFDDAAEPDPIIKQRPELSDGDVATVIYTSGTTGPSKGVIIPWGEFYSTLDIYGCRRDGKDALYTPFPTNHLSGKVPIYNMVAFAGRAVLRRRFSTTDFWSDVRNFHCTGTILLGGVAVFLKNQPQSPDDRNHVMHAVLMVPVIDDYRAFEERFGLRVLTSYGMSECGFPFRMPSGDLPNAETCGQVRNGWYARIVDAEGCDLAVGEIGELQVKCDRPYALMLGYLDRPEATAEAMRGGWFHTGDAMRADAEGNYYFVDRIKDAIRRRGENISSFEVENFVQRYPGILECAAIAVPSETGEDEIKVVFTVAEGCDVDLNELANFCMAEMPSFMVPRYFEVRKTLPYTPTNKVQKADLRKVGIGDAWDRTQGRERPAIRVKSPRK